MLFIMLKSLYLPVQDAHLHLRVICLANHASVARGETNPKSRRRSVGGGCRSTEQKGIERVRSDSHLYPQVASQPIGRDAEVIVTFGQQLFQKRIATDANMNYDFRRLNV